MNAITEICGMKNQTKQSVKAKHLIVALTAGVLITSILLLKYFNLLNAKLELILTPFLVITLLAFGDLVLILFVLTPINFIIKLLNRSKGSPFHQQYTLNNNNHE